jgi:Flp pilus assembly protein TadG
MNSAGRLARRFRPRREEEQGFFLVFFSIMLVLLLGVAGLAVDFSNWTYQGQQQQKAADAAALAGAVFLPDDVATAVSTAADVAKKNGYTNGVNNTDVVITQGTRANQLKVTITRKIKNVFAQAIGFTEKTVRRSATGEYQKPIAMGSPTSQFGNDPESRQSQPDPQYPGFWASVQGGNTDKSQGDGFAAGVCGRDPSPNGAADNCQSGGNTDYDKNGYSYTVHVSQGAGPLVLQAYDPLQVDVGQYCEDPDGTRQLAAAMRLDARHGDIPGYPTPDGIQPRERYATGDVHNVSPYCTGDGRLPGPVSAVDTTFTTSGPATIPGDPNSVKNSSICSTTFPGYTGNDLPKDLTSGAAYIPNAPLPGWSTALGAMFHAWYPLCKISGAGDYFIQVKTSKGNGDSIFALRACSTATAGACQPVQGVGIYGTARMSIYANIGGSSSAFHLARVLPGSEGRSLVLSAFDLADADVAGSFTISGPSGSLTGCEYNPPGTTPRSGPPWGNFSTQLSNCTITGVDHDHYNGRWIQIRIPIPKDYTCDVTNPKDCWFKISFQFPGGVHDTTTWTAYLDGDPVRLIQ